MNTEIDRQRLINTITGQLESDLFLGGVWLPIGRIGKVQAMGKEKMTTDSKTTEETKNSAEQVGIIEEKRQRLSKVGQAVAQCTKCPLHKQRTNTVPGEGNPDARIMFVGEAPGQTEDEQARPFVGQAGKLLTKIIEAMGLNRRDVFIGNILKCRPPGNRDPQVSEIVQCVDFLCEQLQIIEPEIIVALGAHAARTLLESSDSIGELRGRVHEYRPHPLAEPIKLIATYHPAYLLRNYSKDTRMRVWQDMQKVLTELGLPIPKRE